MSDLIDRKNTIDAMENVDWYHQNRSMEMVHGANSDDQAWYKAEDVYGVLERMSSVHPESDLQPTCNQLATDLISRQAAIDALTHKWDGMVTGVFDVLKELPSAQPERKKGKWLPIIETNEFGEPYQAGVHCSRCGHTTVYETSFCPDCGADLRGEQDE